MSKVKRVYVEKQAPYAVKAKELKEEFASFLGIKTVTGVRVLVRYDIENLSDDTYQKSLNTVFSDMSWVVPMATRSLCWTACPRPMLSLVPLVSTRSSTCPS